MRLRSPALARAAVRPGRRVAGRQSPRLLAVLALLAAVVLMRLRAHPEARPVGPTSPTSMPTLATPGARPTPLPPLAVDPALEALIDRLVDEDNGSTAVVIRNLRTGAGAAYHDQEVMASASLAKVPILYEVYRQLAAGTIHLDDRLTVTAEAITGGAGVLQGREGDQLSVAELLKLSVTISDNVAARLLMLRVGGAEAINRSMDALGLSHTRLYSDDRPNTTTAAEMATLMAIVAAGGDARRLPGGATPDSLASLLALAQAQNWLADGIPSGVIVAHKSGQLPGVRNDAGILYTPKGPVVVVGLTGDLANQDEAETFLTRLGHDVYQYFS